MTALTIRNLTKAYTPPLAAINNLSLDVAEGELLALLGPSGCGKTTLLRLIAGLIQPDQGEIAFDGQSVKKLPPQKRGAVMVFQNHQLFPFMSVADNIAFGLKAQRLNRTTIKQKIGEALAMVKLPGYEHRLPDQLSGGERQRVALARALVLNPKLLLLDEPLSSLDAGLRESLRDMICHLQREIGITTIFVTHDQADAVAIANRIALMFNGQIRQLDRPRNFFEQPIDAEVARFFGGFNFLPVRKQGNILETPLGVLEVDSPASDGQMIATIRPEAIELGENGHNNLQVFIKSYTYQGLLARCLTNLDNIELQFVAPPYYPLQEGQEITIHIPRDRIWLLPNA